MQSPSLLASELRNDFEPIVLERHPAIATAKRAMLSKGAVYAALSGSGSAVFGLFADPAEASGAALSLGLSGFRTFITPPRFSAT
jgi:4-diphosphocytidyl-2-C-methyl-D-erythritol kinase